MPFRAAQPYCSKGCRDRAYLKFKYEVDHATWLKAAPFPIEPDDQVGLSNYPEAFQFRTILHKFAPPNAAGIRFGCPKAEGVIPFYLRWFPANGEIYPLSAEVMSFKLPIKGVYLVAYFDERGVLIEPPRYKIDFSWPHRMAWLSGDKSLLRGQK